MCTVHVFVCWVLGTCSAAEVRCPYSSAIEAEWTWTNVCPDDFAGGSWFTMLAMVDSHLYGVPRCIGLFLAQSSHLR